MANKKRKPVKKKQQKSMNQADTLFEKAKQSFRDQIRAARVNQNIDKTLFEGLDYDPIRQKRRIQAVIGTLDKVKSMAGDPKIDHSEVFTVESDWIDINAYPLAGYDLEERYTCSIFAAAIWMLDQLKATESTNSIETEMITAPDDELPTPSVWDLCHSTDSIQVDDERDLYEKWLQE